MLGITACLIFVIMYSLSIDKISIIGDLLSPEFLITYVQTCLINMNPVGLLHGVTNILSLSISHNWESSDDFHSSQYGRFFNLYLFLLPIYATPGDIPTCSISGLGSKYLGISSPYPTLNNIWVICLIWSN